MDGQLKNKRFECCYDAHYPAVMRLAVKSLKRRELAEDICQQVFVSFYMNIERIAPEFEKCWLLRCTRNLIIDHKRKSRRRKEYCVDMEALSEQMGLFDNRQAEMEAHLDSSRLLKRIILELRSINIQWFDALWLNCIEGLSCAEAAKMAGITSDAMRARLYRARVYVRKHYGAEYFV